MSYDKAQLLDDQSSDELKPTLRQPVDPKSIVVSRSTVRRNGVRRAKSGGAVHSMRQRRNPDRSHSSSSTQSMTPRVDHNSVKTSEIRDPSLTDDESINSEFSSEIVPLKSQENESQSRRKRSEHSKIPRSPVRSSGRGRREGSRKRNNAKSVEPLTPHAKPASVISCIDGESVSEINASSASLNGSGSSFSTNRSKKSSSRGEEHTDDCSHRSERSRRGRSSSLGAMKTRRSSSRKRRSDREKTKRPSRGSQTPNVTKSKSKVSEEEIMAVLASPTTSETSSTSPEESTTFVSPKNQPRTMELSKCPHSDGKKASPSAKDDLRAHGVRRSNSAHALDEKKKALRLKSLGVEEKSETRQRRTRNTPRRTRSDNVTAESFGLDNFLRNDQKMSSRQKASSGSRSVSGTRSISSSKSFSGSRSVATTKTAKSRRRRHELQRPLKPIDSDHRRGGGRSGHNRAKDDSDLLGNSDCEEDIIDDDDDDGSVDLDLATARDNFAKQGIDRKLQLHLTKTDELLYSVFPKHVANALRNGQKVEPENHDLVTIFFSDIVGFTDISSKLDPLKISDMLDRLYNSFDALSDYHDVFKVETIGDAYMAVTNLTKDQPDHCKRITEFAIDAIRVANQTLVDEDNPSMGFVNIRVGFHSGSVVSNVVGTRNPRYCLFGDTVNTASRMESNSQKNRIHCSESSAALLRKQCPRMRIYPRGTIDVKGKGEMETFWVHTEGDVSSKEKKNGAIRNIMKAVRKK